MSKYYHLLLAVAKRIGLIGSLYILSLVYCIDLPDDPDNPSNSDVEISLESSGGLISEQLIIDTVGEEIKISVIQRLPSYIKNTNLQIQTLEGTMEWDTTLFTVSKEYCDTIEIVKRIMIAGDKKVIATVFIDNNTIRADTVLANIINRAVPGNEPSAPEHLRITSRSGDSITLKWDVVSNTNFYTLYRSTAATSGFAVCNDSLTAVQLKIASDTNTWFYNVVAANTFGKSGPSNTVSSSDTGNVPPQWSLDTLRKTVRVGTQLIQSLSDICSDTERDIMTYTLLSGMPEGDTIIGTTYQFNPSIQSVGTFLTAIKASDPAGSFSMLPVKITVDNSSEDLLPPEIIFILPSDTNATISQDSFTIDLLCSDPSGVASVSAVLGTTTYTSDLKNGHYLIKINGFIMGQVNVVTVKVKDSSPLGNTISRNLYFNFHVSGNSVTYQKGTGVTGNVPVDANKYQNGEQVVVLGNSGNLAKSGYAFAGWNTKDDGSGNSYKVGSSFIIGSENIVLYAHWTTDPTYTVTYDGNENSGGTVPVDASSYKASAMVTVKGNIGLLVKTNAIFSGWNTAKDGNGTSYAAGDSFLMESVNIVLYAQWSLKPAFTVVYNGNTNSGGVVPVDTNKYEVTATVAVKDNTGLLVKAGNSFAGWNTAANGSGTAYPSGATLVMPEGGITLYAQWTVVDSTAPVFSLKTGPVSGTTVTDPTVNYTYKITDESGTGSVYWILNGTRMADLTASGANGNEYGFTATLRSPPHTNTIVLYATDKSTRNNSDSVSIALTYNKPPSATPQTDLTTLRATALSITLKGADPESDQLSAWTITDDPYHGTITSSRPVFTYTPTGNYEGKDSLTFTVSDGAITSAPAKIVITITANNIAPVITTQPIPLSVNKNQQATFSVAYNSNAYPVPDYIRWIHNNTDTMPGVTGLTLTITASSYADSGNYKAVIRSSAFQTTPAASNNVKLTVKDVTAPVVTLAGLASVEVNQNTSWLDPGATANDDKDGASIPVKTGTLDLTKPGTYTLTYTATDRAGNSAYKQRTITVLKVCSGYTFSCGTCGSWDFETNSVEGWKIDDNPNWPLDGGGTNNGVQSVTVATSKVHSGSYALAAPINTYSSDGEQASVTVPLCQSGTTFNLAGFTFSAWVYFAGPEFEELSNLCLVAWGPGECNISPILWGANITPNTWLHIESNYVNSIMASNLSIHIRSGTEWTGTMYIDDVKITGP